MAEERKELAATLATKEEVEGFLINLEKLKADGSITEEQYASIKEEYEQRLNAAITEIGRIKDALKKRLAAKQKEMESYQSELGKLEVRHRVGELSLEGYQNSTRELQAKFEKLETDTKELKELIEARSSAEARQIEKPLQKQLEPGQRELESYKRELSKLEVKYKVGELTLEEYQRADRELRAKIRALGMGAEELRERVGAESAAGMAVEARKPATAAPALPSVREVAPTGKRVLTPTTIAGMVGGLLLLISVFLPWVAASETLGGEGLGTDSGRDISGLVATLGIIGGLVVLGTAFLRSPKTRGKVRIIMGVLPLVAVLAIVLISVLPLLNESARTLMVIREGFYLYIIAAAVLIVTGILERRGHVR